MNKFKQLENKCSQLKDYLTRTDIVIQLYFQGRKTKKEVKNLLKRRKYVRKQINALEQQMVELLPEPKVVKDLGNCYFNLPPAHINMMEVKFYYGKG